MPADTDPDDLLERLRKRRLKDGRLTVELGPLDHALLRLLDVALPEPGSRLWMELPRGRHDVAVMCGVYLQLRRLGEQRQGVFDGLGFRGPVVVIGYNTNLTERLRKIRIGAESLSEAISAGRVRANGTVVDLGGVVSPATSWSNGLLYLNTSLGWPTLRGVKPGVVIIDRSGFASDDTLLRALQWAGAHTAGRVLVLADIGGVPPKVGLPFRVWPWAPQLVRDVRDELGKEPACGPLSTNPLLNALQARPTAAVYTAPALTAARTRCFAGVRAARRVSRELPRGVDEAVTLLNVCAGLWGTVRSYNECAAAETQAPSLATLGRMIRETHGNDLRGAWSGFAETRWADLRQNALTLLELLEERNPRLDMLEGVLDRVARTHPGVPVVVRTASRAGAHALAMDLTARRPQLTGVLASGSDEAALRLLPYSAKLAWTAKPVVEIHLGVPAPRRRTSLFSGEANERVVVCDPDELVWLQRVLDEQTRRWDLDLGATTAALRLDGLPSIEVRPTKVLLGPLPLDERGAGSDVTPLQVPVLDLLSLFSEFDKAVAGAAPDEAPSADEATDAAAAGREVLAVPVRLVPGTTMCWLAADSTVDVIVGQAYTTSPATDLRAGMSVVLPRGDTGVGLFDRLLAASRQDVDVRAVETMLSRFRRAVLQLHDISGTWDGVVTRMQSMGSSVTSGATCRAWSRGDSIAPDDPEDIRRVGLLTHSIELTGQEQWQRLGRMAEQLRGMRRDLGRLAARATSEAASGASGAALEALSKAYGGIDVSEVVEEFDSHKVAAVGPASLVHAARLRRVLPSAEFPRRLQEKTA
ncbi:DISARM anti-phage system protein DrmE domain-containing protein [Microlunatus sagamiharensis]|uniref:DISARM anti-phage system protein DrmE domain-containing protein n=1 Tax=Microlunatus sagamiharensis TaxID=546874 RepID=UPI0012FDA611|nr:hypothetical protein [Microlunatus sagamiharensis]